MKDVLVHCRLYKRRNVFVKQQTEWALAYLYDGDDPHEFTLHTWEGTKKPSSEQILDVCHIVERTMDFVYSRNIVTHRETTYNNLIFQNPKEVY